MDAKYIRRVNPRVTTCDELKLNPTFWHYVLNSLGLLTLLNCLTNNTVRQQQSTTTMMIYARRVEHLRRDVDRLVSTINRVESELSNYAVDRATFSETNETVVFDAECFLQLAFRIYEQASRTRRSTRSIRSSYSSSSSSPGLVFELDIDVSFCNDDIDDNDENEWSFERKLNVIMDDWVLVYLPAMICRLVQQGMLKYVYHLLAKTVSNIIQIK